MTTNTLLGRISLGDEAPFAPNPVIAKAGVPCTVVSGIPTLPISDKGSSDYVSLPAGLMKTDALMDEIKVQSY